jgi:hypothetical protein
VGFIHRGRPAPKQSSLPIDKALTCAPYAGGHGQLANGLTAEHLGEGGPIARPILGSVFSEPSLKPGSPLLRVGGKFQYGFDGIASGDLTQKRHDLPTQLVPRSNFGQLVGRILDPGLPGLGQGLANLGTPAIQQGPAQFQLRSTKVP